MINGDPVQAPVALEITPGAPSLSGRTSRYEKRFQDLDGIYLDSVAYGELASTDPDGLAYWVDESRAGEQVGALIIGLSALSHGRVGDEFYMTRGHLHAQAGAAEFYYCVRGRGVMVMDDLHGNSSAIEMTPGRGVHVPGGWVHRSVNVGDEVFATMFSYPADAGQNYNIIAKAGGMRTLIVRDGTGGWTTLLNPAHVGYAVESSMPEGTA